MNKHLPKLFFLMLAMLLTAVTAKAAPFAYIPNYETSTLSVLDIATHTLTATITLPGVPSNIQVNPSATRVYISYQDSSRPISVIDTSNNSIIGNVTGLRGTHTRIEGISADGTRLFVLSDSLIEIVDTATNNAISYFIHPTANYNGFAINPAATRIYEPSDTEDSLVVIDIASQTITATIPIDGHPKKVVLNLDGTRAYVSIFGVKGSRVQVIDTASNTVINTIVVDPDPGKNFPGPLLVHPSGGQVFLGLRNSTLNTGSIAIIDTASNTVIDTLEAVGIYPTGFAWNPTATSLYVVDASNLVSVIKLACKDIASFPVGSQHSFLGNFMAPVTSPQPLPSAAPPAPANLLITGMEVTQGIQDLAGNVPLISGRRTFVRVYVKSTVPSVAGVTASLTGLGNIACSPGLCPPVGARLGPLLPINTVGTRITVRDDPKRNNIDDSFLFELPWLWTNYQSIRLHAVLSTDPTAPTASCPADILSEPLREFQHPTTLKIQFIQLSYTLPGTFNGLTNALIETTKAEQLQTEAFILRTYPLSKLLRTPDYKMYDFALGSRVDGSALECKALPPDKLNLCAHNYITSRLAAMQASSGTFFGLVPGPPGIGFIGDADAAYALIPQVPNDKKGIYFTRGACCTNRIGAGPSDDQGYAAHEIGHFLGRQHPVLGAIRCRHSPDDANFPYDISLIADPLANGDLGMAGFDGGDASLGIPFSYRAASTINAATNKKQYNYDFMGYCKPDWISDYTYQNLYICLASLNSDLPGVTVGCPPATGSGSSMPQPGDWLTVFGKVNQATASADMVTRRIDQVTSVPPRSPGNLSIRLLGANGTILASYPFAPESIADSKSVGETQGTLSFGHVVPYVTGTQSIQIIDTLAANQILAAKPVSQNPPAIGNVVFNGAPDPATGSMTVSWGAHDPDADPLSFDLFFIREDSGLMQPLMLGLSGSSIQVSTTDLSGGTGKFRVMASDGVHTKYSDTPAFTLPNKPPRPRILTPAASVTIHQGQLVNFSGEATDPQDGVIPEANLAWNNSGKPMGTGSKLSTADLPLGLNKISLVATNSTGLSETSIVNVKVTEDVYLPGPTLSAGPMLIGWHVDAGQTELQAALLDVGNSGGGDLHFTAQSNASWLTLSEVTGTAPTAITLTADPSGFVGGSTNEAIVTLAADGNPGQTLKVPVTLSVGNTFVVDKPTKKAINQAPFADAGEDVQIGPGQVLALDGSKSYDPENDAITAYEWVQTSGPTVVLSDPTSPKPSFTAPTASAVLVFSLTVRDSGAQGLADTVTVTVVAGSSAPSVSAGNDLSVSEGSSVTLSATANDADGDSLSYQWTQLSGKTVKLMDSQHSSLSFPAPWLASGSENLAFSVTVTDPSSLAASDIVQVQVNNDSSLLDCSQAKPSLVRLWPATGGLVKVTLSGITGPTLTKKKQNFDLKINTISQDEPLKNIVLKDKTSPDAKITHAKRTAKKPLAKDTFSLRAERQGIQVKKKPFTGNGRMYQVSFGVKDGQRSCDGSVTVQVPPTRTGIVIDDGQSYLSTLQ